MKRDKKRDEKKRENIRRECFLVARQLDYNSNFHQYLPPLDPESSILGTPFSFSWNASPKECAGSVEITRVLSPLSDNNTPQLAAEVVLPRVKYG